MPNHKIGTFKTTPSIFSIMTKQTHQFHSASEMDWLNKNNFPSLPPSPTAVAVASLPLQARTFFADQSKPATARIAVGETQSKQPQRKTWVFFSDDAKRV